MELHLSRKARVLALAALLLAPGIAVQAQPTVTVLPEDAPWPVAAESMASRRVVRDSAAVVAWSALPPLELVDALRQGGLVLLVRHGQAVGTDRDPAPWRLVADRRAQGNLTAVGREQARLIADGLRTLGIPVARVVASPYYRTRDFAEIAFHARPTIAAELGAENPGQLEAYRHYLAMPSPKGIVAVVGHLLAPTALQVSQLNELADGHAAVYRPDGKGGATLIALIAPGDWARLVKAVPGG
ncbi:MAG: histidine phosphatase family protein [Alphaproteobacteria bacterium]|nr:histidine phosphatase family protein [Alphaproteobacteria bacterium]